MARRRRHGTTAASCLTGPTRPSILTSWRRVLKKDVPAGLINSVVSVPDGLASAALAGVNPVYGLSAPATPIGSSKTPRAVRGRLLACLQYRGGDQQQRHIRHPPLGLGLLNVAGLGRVHQGRHEGGDGRSSTIRPRRGRPAGGSNGSRPCAGTTTTRSAWGRTARRCPSGAIT
jgi:hypothetical protein